MGRRGNSPGEPKKPKAEYRSLYVGLLDHPKFLGLSIEARMLFVATKLSLGPLGLGHVYLGVLLARTGIGEARVLEESKRELEAAGWIETDGSLWWIVDGLEHEPSLSLKNPKHVVFLRTKLAVYPKSVPLVRRFLARYPELDDGDRPAPPPSPLPNVENSGRGDVENFEPEKSEPAGAVVENSETPQDAALPIGYGDRNPVLHETRDVDTQTTCVSSFQHSSSPTWRDVAAVAYRELGLEALSMAQESTNRSVLNAWRFGENRDPANVLAAIRGLVAMREAGELDEWIAPGEPATLAALHNTRTVHVHRGESGGVVLPLWTVAASRGYSLEEDDAPAPRRTRGASPTTAADILKTLSLSSGEAHA